MRPNLVNVDQLDVKNQSSKDFKSLKNLLDIILNYLLSKYILLVMLKIKKLKISKELLNNITKNTKLGELVISIKIN